MSDEATEIRKQFTAYADAITTFATAQLVGFTLLMTHGDCFTKNVLVGLWYTVCVGVVSMSLS
jgi:Ser/Thr protein kinase RdoA (MazF antagonist)